MKKILSLLMIFAAVAIAKPIHAQQKAKWQELDAFHEVMSKTFHPAEEGKLEPIRTRSQEMLDRAVAWKNSTAPEGYDKSAVLKNLKKLVKGSKEINKMVKKNASDKELKEELTELHDVFHEIVEKCEKGEHH
jgi:uncharacterized coiled-coil DUF342 family protein